MSSDRGQTASQYRSYVMATASKQLFEGIEVPCRNEREAHNHYGYMQRAKLAVTKKWPQAQYVEIFRVKETIYLVNTYDPYLQPRHLSAEQGRAILAGRNAQSGFPVGFPMQSFSQVPAPAPAPMSMPVPTVMDQERSTSDLSGGKELDEEQRVVLKDLKRCYAGGTLEEEEAKRELERLNKDWVAAGKMRLTWEHILMDVY